MHVEAIDALLRRTATSNRLLPNTADAASAPDATPSKKRPRSPESGGRAHRLHLSLRRAHVLVRRSLHYLPSVLPLLESQDARALLHALALSPLKATPPTHLTTSLMENVSKEGRGGCGGTDAAAACAVALVRLYYREPWATLECDDIFASGGADLMLCSSSADALHALYLPHGAAMDELERRATLLLGMTTMWVDGLEKVALGAVAAAREAQMARFFAFLPGALRACGDELEEGRGTATLTVLDALREQLARAKQATWRVG